MSSHEDLAGEFCCVGSIFSMKLLGFVSKAIELLLTELFGVLLHLHNVKVMASSLLQCDGGAFTHMIMVSTFTIASREL